MLAPVLALPMLIVCAAVALPILTVVAAPNAVAVVRLVLKNVSVPVLVPAKVGFAPLTLTVVAVDNVIVGFLIVVVPVVAPIVIAVPAPNKLPVVAVVLAILNVAVLTVKSPPSILTSPSTSRLLLTFVVPLDEPI